MYTPRSSRRPSPTSRTQVLLGADAPGRTLVYLGDTCDSTPPHQYLYSPPHALRCFFNFTSLNAAAAGSAALPIARGAGAAFANAFVALFHVFCARRLDSARGDIRRSQRANGYSQRAFNCPDGWSVCGSVSSQIAAPYSFQAISLLIYLSFFMRLVVNSRIHPFPRVHSCFFFLLAPFCCRLQAVSSCFFVTILLQRSSAAARARPQGHGVAREAGCAACSGHHLLSPVLAPKSHAANRSSIRLQRSRGRQQPRSSRR